MNLVDNELNRERRRLAWLTVCRIWVPVLLVLSFGQGILILANRPRPASSAGLFLLWAFIGSTALLSFLGAVWRGWSAWKASETLAGQNVDDLLADSKNRLEAAAMLSHRGAEALAQAQRDETARYLAAQPTRKRRWTLTVLGSAAVILFILNGMLATDLVLLLETPPPPKDVTPKIPERDPYARIDITAPESEQRLKPIEEVVIKASADSDNGFSSVSLVASVNGAAPKVIPIDPAGFLKGGPVRFKKSLLLDELDVEPFDVVAYHLEAVSKHEKPLKVSSQIQFIEVRPFKENIYKAIGGGAGCYHKLQWLINQELILSKRSWLLGTSHLSAKDPLLVDETKHNGDQQDKVATKTHDLYNELTEKGGSASMVDHLSKAEKSMHEAVDEIRKPDLLGTNPLQQHALGELVAATKEFIKVMEVNPSKEGGKSGPENPFKDDQKTPTSPKDSPISRLADLIKKEQAVLHNLADSGQTRGNVKSSENTQPASDPGNSKQKEPQDLAKTAEDQKSVSKGLDDLLNQPLVSAPSVSALNEAEQAAADSADKMAGNNVPEAVNQALSAEAAMLRAQKTMEDASMSAMKEKLAQAEADLNSAAAKLGGGKMPPGPRNHSQETNSSASGQQPQNNTNPPGSSSQTGQKEASQPSGQGEQQTAQNGHEPGSSSPESTQPSNSGQSGDQAQNNTASQGKSGELKDAQPGNSGSQNQSAMTKSGTKGDQPDQKGNPQGNQSMANNGQPANQPNPPQPPGDREDGSGKDQNLGTPAPSTGSGGGEIQKQADEAREILAQAQGEQAQNGDDKLAKLAGDLVKQYDESGVSGEIARLEQQGNASPETLAGAANDLQKLADQLSEARLGMQSEEQNLQDTIGRVDRILQDMQTNKGSAADQQEMAQELQQEMNTAMSDAQKLLPGDSSQGSAPGGHSGSALAELYLASDIYPGGHAHPPVKPVRPIDFLPLRKPLMAFRDELAARLNDLHSQTMLSYLNPDESPEEYRAQVAAYYERISRETHAANPDSDASTNSR